MNEGIDKGKSSSQDVTKEYKTDDLIVYWNANECSHSGKCWNELPEAFRQDQRPWIKMENVKPEELIKTIDKCPTRALRYKIPKGSSVDPALANGPGSVDFKADPARAITIKMTQSGPLLVQGLARIIDLNGNIIKEANSMVLCACGRSANKPFCDGSHLKIEL